MSLDVAQVLDFGVSEQKPQTTEHYPRCYMNTADTKLQQQKQSPIISRDKALYLNSVSKPGN